MPAASMEVARKEILARFQAAIAASSFPNIKVDYEGVKKAPPAGTAPFIRAGVRHKAGGAVSLGTLNSKRRHQQEGTFFAQVFVPVGKGNSESDPICGVILNAYRTGGPTASGVQFLRPHPEEVGEDGAWWQVNCLVDFQYDLIQ